jgi:hypothetical protein
MELLQRLSYLAALRIDAKNMWEWRIYAFEFSQHWQCLKTDKSAN